MLTLSRSARALQSSVLPRVQHQVQTSPRMISYSPPETYKAVVFDLGGVLMTSPIQNIRKIEHMNGLKPGELGHALQNSPYWHQLERGEIQMPEFLTRFNSEPWASKEVDIDVGALLNAIASHQTIFPVMLNCVKSLRADGIKTALLTNNWWLDSNRTAFPPSLDRSLFDVVIESCRINHRKPEEEIYRLVLSQLELEPKETILLDDIGVNLKGAKKLGIDTIKCVTPYNAVLQLSEITELALTSYCPGTITPARHMKLDSTSLKSFLNHAFGYDDVSIPPAPSVRQFVHGHSNPTYHVAYAGHEWVLRKKPDYSKIALLRSAHLVEREYEVMHKLRAQAVPVPLTHVFCKDEHVLGTPFYIMDYVSGQVFKDYHLPSVPLPDRVKVFSQMNAALAQIHRVNYKAAGLERFGRPDGYLPRNLDRWAKQYESSCGTPLDEMTQLGVWLKENCPAEDVQPTVVHGDFRLDNIVFDEFSLQLKTILDWELSTIGDPWTDLATSVFHYYLPADFVLMTGFSDVDVTGLGIPRLPDHLEEYCHMIGHPLPAHWNFYIAFICYRYAAIVQGVVTRARAGQAASPHSESLGAVVVEMARLGLEISQCKDAQHYTKLNPGTCGQDAIRL